MATGKPRQVVGGDWFETYRTSLPDHLPRSAWRISERGVWRWSIFVEDWPV